MFETKRVEIEWGGRKLTLETGRMARQADAAVLAQYGETTRAGDGGRREGARGPASTSFR